MYGTLELPHVYDVLLLQQRVEVEHFIPSRNVSYRRDHTTLGRAVRLGGQIRESTISGAYTRIDQIRRLNDGVGRTFDLEDGTTETFTGKMADPSFLLTVGEWFAGNYRVNYTLTILEVESA